MPTPTSQNPFPNDQTQNAADLLGRVHVAAPCTASWEAMPGGERVRSCEKCAHKVYNLSAMTAYDAARLVSRAEGKDAERVCVRFYRRSDGTMLTQDCPVGVRALRQRAARRVSAAFAGVGVLFGISLAGRTRDEQPRLVQMVLNAIDPPPTAIATPEPISEPAPHFTATAGMVSLPMARDIPPPPPPAVMGDMAVAPPPGPPSSFEGGPEPAPPVPDKSFLRGVRGGDAASEAAPAFGARPDPFASHMAIKGKVSLASHTQSKETRP